MDRNVKNLETSTAIPLELRLYYQRSGGGIYWHENAEGRWVAKTKEQFSRWLQTQGRSPFMEKGAIMSEIDDLLTTLETDRMIDYAGPLAGWSTGPRTVNGRRILVTEPTKLMEPEELEIKTGDIALGWPTVYRVIVGLLNGHETIGDKRVCIEQVDLFFTWLKHLLESLYDQRYTTGLALAIAGEVECGKSLLAHIIREITGGKVCHPYRYMSGQDNFNGDVMSASLLLVDDENPKTDIASRNRFGSDIKQCVAVEGTRIRAMHMDAVHLDPIQRLVILCNNEPDRIQVLPPMDDDIADKMLILKGYRKQMPMPSETPAEREAFWKTIEAELPYFVGWLLFTYDPPRESQGRFGPKAWVHPAVLEELGKLDPSSRTKDLILQFLKNSQPRLNVDQVRRLSRAVRNRIEPIVRADSAIGWIGTPTELRDRLMSDEEGAPLSAWQRREVRKETYLGRDLRNLAKRYPDTILFSRTESERCYVILGEPLPGGKG